MADIDTKEEIIDSTTVTETEPVTNESSKKTKKAGQMESIVSLICYLGAFIAGALILKLSKQNRFIRFNAAQSIVFTAVAAVLAVIVHIIPFLGSLLSIIIILGSIALWVIMMIKASRHEEFRIPIISYYADKLVNYLDKKAAERNSKQN